MAKTNFLVIFALSTAAPILCIVLAYMTVLLRWLWYTVRKVCCAHCCGDPSEDFGTLTVQKFVLGLLFIVYPQVHWLLLLLLLLLLL